MSIISDRLSSNEFDIHPIDRLEICLNNISDDDKKSIYNIIIMKDGDIPINFANNLFNLIKKTF